MSHFAFVAQLAERSLGKTEVPSPILGKGSLRQAQCELLLSELLPGYPSGQRGQTVNLLGLPFLGSNPRPGTDSAGSL